MKKALLVVMALVFAAGLVYAAEGEKSGMEPVRTMVEDTGKVVKTAAQGVADTVDVTKNEPVTTAAKATAKVAEGSVKTLTLQKVDDNSGSANCSQ